MCAFKHGDNIGCKSFSGTIIKKNDDDTYMMLTSASAFAQKDGDNNALELSRNPSFYVQRTGLKEYGALFEVTSHSKYGPYAELEGEAGLSGVDLAVCTVKKMKGDCAIADLPKITASTVKDLDDATTIAAGYPLQKFAEGAAAPNENCLFTQLAEAGDELKVEESTEGHAYAQLAQTVTPGQEGGPVTAEDGRVLAVYSSEFKDKEETGQAGASVITEKVVEWLTA